MSLSPSSERLTLRKHRKPNGNRINGHPAYESHTHKNSTKMCQKWGHKVLLLWYNTLKFHKLDLYSHRQHFHRTEKGRVDLFTGPRSSSDSWRKVAVLKCCTFNSLNWHRDRQGVTWSYQNHLKSNMMLIVQFIILLIYWSVSVRPWGYQAPFSSCFLLFEKVCRLTLVLRVVYMEATVLASRKYSMCM